MRPITFDAFSTKAVDPKSSEASPRERDHVARVVVEVTFAINCTLKDYYWLNFIDGGVPQAKWEGDVPFASFVENAFRFQPTRSQTTAQREGLTDTVKHKKALKAWKLTKRYGLKIRGTNNLLEHLALDLKTKTLKVFHQVSFLRAHLAKTKEESLDLSF